MNFLKRGFLSIIRKPLKMGILFLVVFILGNLMAGAVSIKKTLNNTEEKISQNLQPIATVSLDYKTLEEMEDLEEVYSKLEMIGVDAINKIGALEYVKYYDYTLRTSLSSKTMKRYTQSEDTVSYEEAMYFNLEGIEYSKMLQIEQGKISLKEGRLLSDEDIKEGTNYVIVGNKFAETNDLHIGSMVSLSVEVYPPVKENEVNTDMAPTTFDVEYEIIGLFETKKEPTTSKKENHYDESYYQKEELENTFYTSNNAVIDIMNTHNDKYTELGGEIDDRVFYEPIYVLKDMKMLEDFKEEASAFLPKYNIIQDSTTSLNNVKKPMESINEIATIILYASIGVTVLILSLLVTLFLHDRRHEIGIYMAMGERKVRVIGQISVEVLVVSMISISLALVTGNFISKDVSKNMLMDQTEEISDEGIMYYDATTQYTPTVTGEELINNYSVSLDGGTIMMFYSIGLLTIMVSTIVPTTYILRLKPKKILM
jgi:putative ABC transport system permease protein